MIENLNSSLDNGTSIETIAVALSKVFDSLSHGLVVAKLFACDDTLPVCTRLCNYLRVKLSDAKSGWIDIEYDVPQGSLLVPLLFNIFTNDIFFIDNDVIIYNYIDDTCISYAHKDIEIIKSDLEHDIKKLFD